MTGSALDPRYTAETRGEMSMCWRHTTAQNRKGGVEGTGTEDRGERVFEGYPEGTEVRESQVKGVKPTSL